MPFSASFKGPFPSTAAYMTDNNPNMSLVPSSCKDTKTTEVQISGKAVPSPVVAHPAQNMHYPPSSFLGSASGPLLTPPPSLLTPDQLVPSRPPVISFTQAMCPDKKDIGTMPPTSFNSPSVVSPQVTQPPLLPLPTRNLQPAYKKDDFFDTISCNSLNQGTRDGRNRFSERMKLDTETFGNFRQRGNLGFGGHCSGRGGNYRGSYGGGRGYGYSESGHGSCLGIFHLEMFGKKN